jgi:glycosidase
MPDRSATSTPFEFHLSRLTRQRYQFDRDLYRWEGGVLVPDSRAVQELVQRMNERLGPLGKGGKPGHLYALALIQYVLHVIVERYRQQRQPKVLELALNWLGSEFSVNHAENVLRQVGNHYAPLTVFRGELPLESFLEVRSGEITGRERVIEQTLLVFLANVNPAAATIRDLYDDHELPPRDEYLKQVWSLEKFFATQPTFGPKSQSLFELLAAPAKASPNSLLGQLEFIRQNWGEIIGDVLIKLLLTAEDLVREDERMPWRPGGQNPDLEYLKLLASKAMFAGAYAEPERFSPDLDWMPRVVLLAKSVYVWLDQLSRRYGRAIRQLDEIPDEELDRLASWGFSGVWLIGLWERSMASRTVKHIRGNVDAVASAYSIYDYKVSGDLGGDPALVNLKTRAAARGIRIASDMVPNHMGIDSTWTRAHPDWFIQLDYPPYGAYRYTGPDLSGDPGIEIRIEDGYWSQSDAAVVFQRIDKRYGDTRFIYHGNDGTSMPWNDTAQLDFLKAEVREAMIQLILHVARQCPILRFDAAMTLTKKHFQRLWYPEPGTGGAIPSRALYGLTREEFDKLMPVEFWREVVDRVATEAPDTLLIAEAFWLLEGYFVRTLGMHRVYNSAFMNMLKLEENAKYRAVIKNVLEFDPRVLQRFVNFMNNPDEDTAVAQFGKGDKYFGVCLMMTTMPGLPMFGHGQIEGLTEKYGHEYQRAYYDETPDEELVRRHEREIFPFLRQRELFSGAEHFILYDVFQEGGRVDENVFAYSNGYGDARSLVVFHNRYAETSGWIHKSSAFSVPDGEGRKLIQKTLAESLGLKSDPVTFYILRDRIAGLEYLRSGRELTDSGLFVSLRAYQYQVFTEFREVHDDAEGRWTRLAGMLGGRGVASVDREYKKVYLAPLISAFEAFATPANFRALLTEPPATQKSKPVDVVHPFAEKSKAFLEQAKQFGGGTSKLETVIAELETMARAVLTLPSAAGSITFDRTQEHKQARVQLLRILPEKLSADRAVGRVLCGWLAVWGAGQLLEEPDRATIASRRLEDWLLSETLERTFRTLGATDTEAWHEVELVRALVAYYPLARSFHALRKLAKVVDMMDDPCVQRLVGCHPFGGVVWFHRESLEDLRHWLMIFTVLDTVHDETLSKSQRAAALVHAFKSFSQISDLAAISEFQLERFKLLLGYAAHYSGEGPVETPAVAAPKKPKTK